MVYIQTTYLLLVPNLPTITRYFGVMCCIKMQFGAGTLKLNVLIIGGWVKIK